jgi:hypothetical protein
VACDETSANVVAWVAKNVVTPHDHLTIVSHLSPYPEPSLTDWAGADETICAIRLDDRRELLRAFATHVRDCPTLI